MFKALFSLMVAVLVGLTGCGSMTSRHVQASEAVLAGHGSGVAVFSSGEVLTIDKSGQVAGRCLLCDDDAAVCERNAQTLGIGVCASSGTELPRGTLTCAAYGPTGPLPPVPYGTPGYQCFLTSPVSCTCFKQ